MKIIYKKQKCTSCNQVGGIYAVTDDSKDNIVIFNGCNNCTYENIVYRTKEGIVLNPTQLKPAISNTAVTKIEK